MELKLDEGLKTPQVTVRWQHRGGTEQMVQLASGIARLAPVYSGLIEVPPQDHVLAVHRPLPAASRLLAEGRHTLVRPTPSSPVAWVVDNAKPRCRS